MSNMDSNTFFRAPDRSVTIKKCQEGENSGQVQSDWAESDTTKPAFIKNKPTIGSGNETENTPTNTPTISFQPASGVWDSLKRAFKAVVNIPALITPGWNGLSILDGKLFVKSIGSEETGLVKVFIDEPNERTLLVRATLNVNDLVAAGSNALSVVDNKLFVSQQSGGQQWYEYIAPNSEFFIQVEASKQTVVVTYDAPTAKMSIETSDGLKCKIRTIFIAAKNKARHDSSGSMQIIIQGNLVEHISPIPNTFNPQWIKYPRQHVLNVAADNVSENTPYLDDMGLVICEKWYIGIDNEGTAVLRFIGLDQLNQYNITLDF